MPTSFPLRAVLIRHRRTLVALLLAAACGTAVHQLTSARMDGRTVLVAAADLPPGHELTAADLAPRTLPEAAVPDGVLSDPGGQVLAGPVRRGTVLTDADLRGRSTTIAMPAGRVAMAVPVDPVAVTGIGPGERVDVLAGGRPGEGQSRRLAAAAVVLEVPAVRSSRGLGGAAERTVLVLSVQPDEAIGLASVSGHDWIAVARLP